MWRRASRALNSQVREVITSSLPRHPGAFDGLLRPCWAPYFSWSPRAVSKRRRPRLRRSARCADCPAVLESVGGCSSPTHEHQHTNVRHTGEGRYPVPWVTSHRFRKGTGPRLSPGDGEGGANGPCLFSDFSGAVARRPKTDQGEHLSEPRKARRVAQPPFLAEHGGNPVRVANGAP